MATYSADVQLLPPLDASQQSIRPIPLNAWQLATIEWGTNQVTGFVNKAAAIDGLPVDLVVNAARIAPGGMKRPKRDGSIGAGVVPMQTAKVKLQDKNRALSQLIAEKRANGIGLRGKVLRLYEWDEGQDIDFDRDLVGTYRLDDRGTLDGYKTLTGLDIRRQLKEEILDPQSYRLVESITDTSTTITIDFPYDFVNDVQLPVLSHNSRYSSDPDESVMYVRMPSGEIVKLPEAYMNIITNTRMECTNCKRGALNTSHLIESVTVDPSDEPDSRPELVEWIYLEETLPDFIRMITTGFSFDGRSTPEHWDIAMDVRWLDEDSLLYSAPELASLPLRLENYGAVTVKDLIESEILPFLPATMQVNARGQIQLRRITTIKDTGPDRHRFDANVLDRKTLTEVTSQVSHIKQAIGIKAGWDARSETFSTPILFGDGALQAANDDTQDAEILILESKLLHSSIHTNAQIRRLLPAMAEHYLGEKLVFSIRSKPTAAIVDVGQRAHVNIPGVTDDASLSNVAGDIDRSFLVTSVSPDEGGTLYQFTGTSGLAADYFDQLTAPSLSDDEYTRNATPLQDDLPPGALSESGGIYYLQSGTYPLSFRKKYVFTLGPLYQESTATITCAAGQEGPMFQLWIPHAWHSDSPTTVITTGKGGRAGGVAGAVGGAGFAVPTTGTGTLSAKPFTDRSTGSGDTQITGWALSSRAGAQAESYSTGDVPSITLSYNDGALVGLPSDLSGYAGIGGGETVIESRMRNGSVVTSTHAGGQGASNSAGVLIVCRGASMGPAARFIVSGENGDMPVVVSRNGDSQDLTNKQFYNQAGSGSGPGTVIIGIDGPFPNFDLAAQVEAFPGQTFYQGTHMSEPTIPRVAGGVHHSHFKSLPHTVNLSGICSRILYMPAAAKVQERPVTGVDLAFINQRDNKIILIPNSGADPSDANPGDMTVSVTDISNKSDLAPASAKVMDNNYVWQTFDWIGDSRRTAYLNLLQSNRTNGGTEYYNQETRPLTFTPGSLWRQPSSKITWILERFGPPDRFAYFDDAPVSDNRFKDPEFTDLLIGGDDWVIRSDIDTLPTFAISSPTVALEPTIIEITISGGAEITTDTGATLPGIPSVTALVYSPTEVEVTFTPPDDLSGIDAFEVYRNYVLVSTVQPYSQYSYYDSGLTGATTYTYTVRAVNASENGPFSVPYTVTTDDPVAATNTLYAPTTINATVYSSTAIEIFWTPPADRGVGTGYEIRRDNVLITTLSGNGTNSYFESGLVPNTVYSYSVRLVGGGERSDDVTVSLTTNA